MRLQKCFVALIFLIFVSPVFAQKDNHNIDIYQGILNHPKFIEIIDRDSSLLCNGTLIYKSNSIPSGSILKFKEKAIIPVGSYDNNNCSQLSLPELSSKKRFTVRVVINKFSNQEVIGKCLNGNNIIFECKVKRKKSGYKIVKTTTRNIRYNALLL